MALPILNGNLKRRVIREGLRAYLADNAQSWEMTSDGDYRVAASRRRQRVCAQELLLADLRVPK
ncbi:MAG: hypothetical protein AB7Q97_26070 [Gammaproteobacteria bacterium]